MDTLPNEILSKILTHLPQRYAIIICSTVCKKWNLVIFQSIFYSTIDIYSKLQLKRVVQLAKEKKTMINDDKSIGYYVKRLIFHYEYILQDYDIKDLLVFPNLQYIDGLYDDRDEAQKHKSVYLQLNQPTNFYYFDDDNQLVEKFINIKNNLNSLNIYVTKKLINFIPQQQQLETIHLKSLKNIIKNRRNEQDEVIPLKMLVLPTTSLTNLIKLNIGFYCYKDVYMGYYSGYFINEYTFENIHQSCPLLESLSLEEFNMNISDEYQNNNDYNKKIMPAHCLKNLEIFNSNFNDPLCISYLTIKYPHLEFLSLDSWLTSGSSEIIERYENVILNMLRQLPLLKKLCYKLKGKSDKAWPRYEFIEWLEKHFNQLTHIEYSFPLTINGCKKINEININNNNNNDIISSLTQQQQQQFNFLNHLTSLSLRVDNAVHLTLTYLLQNKNTTIVSTTLQELKIKHNEKATKLIYFYDWLDMFPNLLLFEILFAGYILDNSSFFNDYNSDYTYNKGDIISNKLHQLIKERKQKQQYDILNNTDKHHTIYKLKCLGIGPSHLWFKNGLDEPLKKCHHLKKLSLSLTYFINTMNPLNEIHLDISHLHLELLDINYIYCSPNNIKTYNEISTLIVHETITDRKYVIGNKIDNNRTQHFTLYLKCKFLDGLIHDFE